MNKRGSRSIAVVGLGYVGLPIAVAFGKIAPVIGFDINKRKIEDLLKGLETLPSESGDRLETEKAAPASSEPRAPISPPTAEGTTPPTETAPTTDGTPPSTTGTSTTDSGAAPPTDSNAAPAPAETNGTDEKSAE